MSNDKWIKVLPTDNADVCLLKNLLKTKQLSVPMASAMTGVAHKSFYRWLAGKGFNRLLYNKVIAKLKEAKIK